MANVRFSFMTVIDMFRQIYAFCRNLLSIFNFIGIFAGVLTYSLHNSYAEVRGIKQDRN